MNGPARTLHFPKHRLELFRARARARNRNRILGLPPTTVFRTTPQEGDSASIALFSKIEREHRGSDYDYEHAHEHEQREPGANTNTGALFHETRYPKPGTRTQWRNLIRRGEHDND